MDYILIKENEERKEIWNKMDDVNKEFQLENGDVFLTTEDKDSVDRETYIDGNDLYLFSNGLMALVERSKKLIFVKNKNDKNDNEVVLAGDGSLTDSTNENSENYNSSIVRYISQTSNEESAIEKILYYRLNKENVAEKGDDVDINLFQDIDYIDEYTAFVSENGGTKVVYYREEHSNDGEVTRTVDSVNLDNKQLNMLLDTLADI